VRHVYLPALRDAEQELASAGGDRVLMIFRGLLGDDKQVDAFVERIGTELKKVAAAPDVVRVREKIGELFLPKASRTVTGADGELTKGTPISKGEFAQQLTDAPADRTVPITVPAYQAFSGGSNHCKGASLTLMQLNADVADSMDCNSCGAMPRSGDGEVFVERSSVPGSEAPHGIGRALHECVCAYVAHT
jgi:hypothetical protein